MRIAAIVVVMLVTQGLPSGEYLLFWLVIVGCPIVNLITLLTGGKDGYHFLDLYFKRRRLEEQKRIEALEKVE
jgi:hypothetical protein